MMPKFKHIDEPAFNLIDERWIPVRKGNQVHEVSLKEALLKAHVFDRIENPSPLVEVALLRILLAVLHRALAGPKSEDELLELFAMGQFPKDQVNLYLDAYRNRFWLFHPEAPFWQIADLPADKPSPWTKLRYEFASGNNPTLFSHVYDDAPPPISPAEAARSLALHQTFVAGGLIKKLGVESCKAAPIASAAVFIAEGKNLFETLVYALGVYLPDGDKPFWEEEPLKARDVAAAEDGKPKTRWRLVGRTRVYTWVSRGVRLLPEEDGNVRYIAYGPGVHPKGPELPQDDPFLALLKDPHQGRLSAVRLREDRAFWRDFTSLFPEEGKGTTPGTLQTAYTIAMNHSSSADPIPLTVIGQITRQDKVLEVRRERYPLPRVDLGRLQNYIHNAIKYVDRISDCLQKATWNLASELLNKKQEPLTDKRKRLTKEERKRIKELQNTFPASRHYFYSLGIAFPSFLLSLSKDATSALKGWQNTVERAAIEAWDLTRNTLGTESRQLKAIQAGERTLDECLRKVRKGSGNV